MTYNNLLIKLYDVIKQVNKDKDPNYNPSELFSNLSELLNLEKICEEYVDRYKSLTKDEVIAFNNFAKLDGDARKKIKEDYAKAYKMGLINKIYLPNYKKYGDYVAAIFLNELKCNFFSACFAKKFNSTIKKVYTEDETLLNIFKIQSNNYKKINKNEKDIGMCFRRILKEFEILTSIYNVNELLGIKITRVYDEILSKINYINKINELIQSLENFNFDNLDMLKNIQDEYNKLNEEKESKLSLSNVFLKLENSKNWFSNKYLQLIIHLTNSDFYFSNFTKNSKTQFSMGIFINYLSNQDFLKNITKQENGVVVFRDLNYLFDLMKKCELDNSEKIDYKKINDFFDRIENLFKKVSEGSVKIPIDKTENKGCI